MGKVAITAPPTVIVFWSLLTLRSGICEAICWCDMSSATLLLVSRGVFFGSEGCSVSLETRRILSLGWQVSQHVSGSCLVRRSRQRERGDRKSTRLNSSHVAISYAVSCLKKKQLTQE